MIRDYEAAAERLTDALRRARAALEDCPDPGQVYALERKIRDLYDVRRDVRTAAAYLAGYYDRKFVFSARDGGDDFEHFEARNHKSVRRRVFGLAATERGSATQSAESCYFGADGETTANFDYVP